MKRIHVMAAVIERGDAVFIARRPDHLHQGGKWEFPGGKLEAGESPLQGLTRELHEEIGIEVQSAQPLIRICHDYPDKSVLLDVWRVTAFAGDPHGKEGQRVQWVPRHILHEFEFPAANVPIVAAVQLPTFYMISPEVESIADFVQGLRKTVERGFRLIQIRVRQLTREDGSVLLAEMRALKREYPVSFLCNSALDLIAGDAPQSSDWSGADVFDGLHLTSRDLARLSRRPDNLRWLAASCHSLEEIRLAEKLGVDFVTLSPVKPTLSHPDAQPLGMTQFAEWVEQARVPVFGLGGLDEQDLSELTAVGAQGVAGIRGLWQFRSTQCSE